MSPYGVAKAIGGDNPSNDQKMESCVSQVMSQGKDKVTAIKICKASLDKHQVNKTIIDKLQRKGA